MDPKKFNVAPVMGSVAPEMPVPEVPTPVVTAPEALAPEVLTPETAAADLSQTPAEQFGAMVNQAPAEQFSAMAEQAEQLMPAGERSVNDIYSEIVDDLHALQKALEKQPDSEKLKTYVALNQAILDTMMEEASLEAPASAETLSGLGAAANSAVTVNGGELTSDMYGQSGPEPAVSNPGVQEPPRNFRFDQNGMLLMEDEQSAPTTWQGGEQNV